MFSILSFIIVIFGGLNWLCIGFFQYDIVAGLFGFQGSIFSRIVYIVVGISALYLTFAIIKNKGRLNMKKEMKNMAQNNTQDSSQNNNQNQNTSQQNSVQNNHPNS